MNLCADRLAIVSKQVESIDTVRRAGEKQQKGSKKVETDAGVEEGEVIEEVSAESLLYLNIC